MQKLKPSSKNGEFTFKEDSSSDNQLLSNSRDNISLVDNKSKISKDDPEIDINNKTQKNECDSKNTPKISASVSDNEISKDKPNNKKDHQNIFNNTAQLSQRGKLYDGYFFTITNFIIIHRCIKEI